MGWLRKSMNANLQKRATGCLQKSSNERDAISERDRPTRSASAQQHRRSLKNEIQQSLAASILYQITMTPKHRRRPKSAFSCPPMTRKISPPQITQHRQLHRHISRERALNLQEIQREKSHSTRQRSTRAPPSRLIQPIFSQSWPNSDTSRHRIPNSVKVSA